MMKVEFIDEGAPECPLLRIYDFDQPELRQFQATCFELSQGRMHKQLIAGPHQNVTKEHCAILGYVDGHDRGLCATKADYLFVLCLTNESWLEVAEKLQRLLDERSGYQWLSDQGEIKLLVSYDGKW